MYFSTFHWNMLVNGYSGFSPPSYQDLHDDLEQLSRTRCRLATLRKRGTTHVIVHGAFMRDGEYPELVSPHGQLRGSSVRDGDAVAPGRLPASTGSATTCLSRSLTTGLIRRQPYLRPSAAASV